MRPGRLMSGLLFVPLLVAAVTVACRGSGAERADKLTDHHHDHLSFSDGLARNRNEKGEELGRNSTSLWNAAYEDFPSWDGRLVSLEQHSGGAFRRIAENVPDVIARIDALPGYREQFKAVFGEDVNFTNVTWALAAFQRSLLSWKSGHDRFEAGDRRALTEEQQLGRKVFFGKGSCATCHAPPLFTDHRFHNLGVPPVGPVTDDPGRFGVIGDERERGSAPP